MAYLPNRWECWLMKTWIRILYITILTSASICLSALPTHTDIRIDNRQTLSYSDVIFLLNVFLSCICFEANIFCQTSFLIAYLVRESVYLIVYWQKVSGKKSSMVDFVITYWISYLAFSYHSLLLILKSTQKT